MTLAKKPIFDKIFYSSMETLMERLQPVALDNNNFENRQNNSINSMDSLTFSVNLRNKVKFQPKSYLIVLQRHFRPWRKNSKFSF